MSVFPCRHTEADKKKLQTIYKKMPAEDLLIELCTLFKSLGDPTRIRILYTLSLYEMCVCELARLTSLSPSAISHQMRVLRMNRLVKFRKEGKNVYYSLDDDHVRHLINEGLCHIAEK